MQRHGHGEGHGIDIMTETQWEEKRGHAQKVMRYIEERMRQEHYNQLDNQLDRIMTEIMLTQVDVAELYSPQRVTAVAKAMGLKAGWGLNITTRDTDGRAWHLNDVEMGNRAPRRLLKHPPTIHWKPNVNCIRFNERAQSRTHGW